MTRGSKISFKGKVVQGVHDMFHVWKKEMRKVFHDQGVLIFFLLVPLAYPLLYSFIYNNEVVREVPAIVVDDSDSGLSRRFIRMVDATADIAIVARCTDMDEAKRMLRDGKAYGIYYFPSDFTDKLSHMEQSQVSIFCDMSGLLYYKAMLLSATEVSLKLNERIKIARAGNFTAEQDEVTAMPIEYESVALFNPQNGFASFLIPAVLVLIIQQTLLLGVGLSVGTDRERNRFNDLVPISRHYNGTLRIVFGKALAYLMVYAVVSIYVLCVVPWMFSLPQVGQPASFLAFMLPLVLACIFFAMTLSVFVRNRETCMLIFVFTSVPLLFLSGISWPACAIPDLWRWFSYIFPSTFGIRGYVAINSTGATLDEVSADYVALWVQAGIYFVLACVAYRWQIIRSRRHAIGDYKRIRNMAG